MIVGSIATPGRYVFAVESRRSLPSATRPRMSAAVNVFETLAIENAVSAVTGRPLATSARPLAPCQADPSAKMIETEMPGIPFVVRRRSRRASRAAVRAAVALGGIASGTAHRGGRTTGELAGVPRPRWPALRPKPSGPRPRSRRPTDRPPALTARPSRRR